MCLETDKTWGDESGKRFERIAEYHVEHLHCKHQVPRLEAALEAHRLRWLLYPLEAFFDAREARARLQRQSVKNDWGANYKEFSLAAELQYRSAKDLSVYAFTHEGMLARMADDSKRTSGELASYESAMERWRQKVMSSPRWQQCGDDRDLPLPPLGWMLGAQDRRVLECMAMRAAASGILLEKPETRAGAATPVSDPRVELGQRYPYDR